MRVATKVIQTLQSAGGVMVRCTIIRHEVPFNDSHVEILAYGFKELSFLMEDDIPVLYEIGVTSEEDKDPWPHLYIWVKTGEELPEGLRQDSFVGTARFLDGRVLHLFRDWRR